MDLEINNITFIIVCYKSEKVIYKCLDSLPKYSKKILIENSKNIKLKNEIELKYDNIEVIINENTGMGASNNIGIIKSLTDFVYVINPDTFFKSDTIEKLINEIKKINDFAILSPIISDKKFPNFKGLIERDNIDKNIIAVETLDGFSMLINKNKFDKNNFFDEKIFLYLENDDLCLRARKSGHKIYIIKNSEIDHAAASSSNLSKFDLECLRNWHWMWSKFYFNKKHYGYLKALSKVSLNLFSSFFKYFLSLIISNKLNKKIYLMRLKGLLASIKGKRSYFRLND